MLGFDIYKIKLTDSDGEPIRLFRGSGGGMAQPTGTASGSGSDDDSPTYAPGVGEVGKKPKKKEKAISFRDKQIQMREEFEAAKES